MAQYHVTVTRQKQGAAAMIQDALARGRNVMAKAHRGGWFRVNTFREELIDPQHPEWGTRWVAVGFSRGHLSGVPGPLEVRTVNWSEYVDDKTLAQDQKYLTDREVVRTFRKWFRKFYKFEPDRGRYFAYTDKAGDRLVQDSETGNRWLVRRDQTGLVFERME